MSTLGIICSAHSGAQIRSVDDGSVLVTAQNGVTDSFQSVQVSDTEIATVMWDLKVWRYPGGQGDDVSIPLFGKGCGYGGSIVFIPPNTVATKTWRTGLSLADFHDDGYKGQPPVAPGEMRMARSYQSHGAPSPGMGVGTLAYSNSLCRVYCATVDGHLGTWSVPRFDYDELVSEKKGTRQALFASFRPFMGALGPAPPDHDPEAPKQRYGLALNESRSVLYCVGGGGKAITAWDAREMRKVGDVGQFGSEITSIFVGSSSTEGGDVNRLVVQTINGAATIYDVRAGGLDVVRTFKAHEEGEMLGGCYLPGKGHFVTTSNGDKCIRCWADDGAKMVWEVRCPEERRIRTVTPFLSAFEESLPTPMELPGSGGPKFEVGAEMAGPVAGPSAFAAVPASGPGSAVAPAPPGGAFQPLSLPAGFEQAQAPNGLVYYVNHHAQTTSWTHPSAGPPPAYGGAPSGSMGHGQASAPDLDMTASAPEGIQAAQVEQPAQVSMMAASVEQPQDQSQMMHAAPGMMGGQMMGHPGMMGHQGMMQPGMGGYGMGMMPGYGMGMMPGMMGGGGYGGYGQYGQQQQYGQQAQQPQGGRGQQQQYGQQGQQYGGQ